MDLPSIDLSCLGRLESDAVQLSAPSVSVSLHISPGSIRTEEVFPVALNVYQSVSSISPRVGENVAQSLKLTANI